MSDNLVQAYSIYINAPAQRVWEAITQSEHTNRWGYGGDVELDPRPGGVFNNLTTQEMKQMGMGDVAIEGTVIEIDPPHRLVLSWKASWYPDSEPTQVSWELTEYPSGLTRVLLTRMQSGKLIARDVLQELEEREVPMFEQHIRYLTRYEGFTSPEYLDEYRNVFQEMVVEK